MESMPDGYDGFSGTMGSPWHTSKSMDEFLGAKVVSKKSGGRGSETTRTMCESVSAFFKAAAQALRILGSHVKLEILHGSLNEEMSKMRLKSDASRPSEFPKEYIRMWLSNVPSVIHGL